jgi:SSS family solute:Na+ symporter
VSDLLNGVGLLVGGLLITYLGLKAIGNGGVVSGVQTLYDTAPEKMNSIGGKDQSVPVSTILSGVILLTTFYWCTNQQIIQRTFGAKSLAEGQKGVLTAGIFKLLAPLIVVIPGIIAYVLFAQKGMNDVPGNEAYGRLVSEVLPTPLIGFFGAVLLGAILSSFNSALNSACTLFSLGMYKPRNPDASEADIVRSGRIFGLGITILAVIIAPILDSQGTIFNHLQKMNAIYFIPILAVVLVGMTTGRVPAKAAKITLIGGVVFIALGYWVWPFSLIVGSMNDFYFLGIVFMHLIAFMLIYGGANPMEKEFVQEDVGAVDMTPWPHARKAGAGLIIAIIAIYMAFADFSVLKEADEDGQGGSVAEQVDADVLPAPAPDSDAASPAAPDSDTDADAGSQ